MARSQRDIPLVFLVFLKKLKFELKFEFIWRPKMDERLLSSFMG
jgi:hypothetical protein